MKILISKLPRNGWWPKGIPKYEDNPAMIEGEIPNMFIAEKERQGLIKAIIKSGHDIIELDFPIELDNENQNHDFIFVRDSFISNQKGTAVILRAGEPKRRIENKIIKKYLESIGLNIIQIPDKKKYKADGGEFYFCLKDNILFSGLQRNTLEGANFVAESLNVEKMIIIKGNGYHLDTFFTPVLGRNGSIVALIVCISFLSEDSKNDLNSYANSINIPILEIPPDDALGIKNAIGNFAVNALPLPGVLIRPSNFSSPSIDKKLKALKIDQIIAPTSQLQLSGGAIHCATNEL